MTRALLVIDVQNEYVTGNLPIAFPPVEESLGNIGRAIDAANAAGVAVIVIQHSAPGAPIFDPSSQGWQLHEVVASRPCEVAFEKSEANAFVETGLDDWLREHSIDTLTLVGYMTQHCDETTAKHAADAGYAVELLSDATGTLPLANAAGSATAEEIHRVITVMLHSEFAAVATTEAWIAMLDEGGELPRDDVYSSSLAAREG